MTPSDRTLWLALLRAGGPARGGLAAKHVRAALPSVVLTDAEASALAMAWRRLLAVRDERARARHVAVHSPLQAAITRGETAPDRLARRRRDAGYRAERVAREAAERAVIAHSAQAAADLLAVPIAALWRADRRAIVAELAADIGRTTTADWAEHQLACAQAAAVAATLDAIARVARRLPGCSVRHRSAGHDGRLGSTYIVIERRGRTAEIRISDHRIPTAEDRPWSMAAQERSARAAPRWGEVVVDASALSWSRTRWLREIAGAIHG